MSRKIDDYLEKVARQLRHLPANVRDNEVREMRSHLEQLTEDFEAQGLALDTAQTRAVEMFGSPHALGAKLCDAWEGIPFSWWRALAALCAITALWIASIFAITLPILIIGTQPAQGLFPELLPSLAALYASVPFGCGLLFSHWVGRRGRLITLIYFVVVLLILRLNLSFDASKNSSALNAPDFFIAYVNATWLPFFNIALAFAGSVVGHNLKVRTRYRLAMVGATNFHLQTTRILFVPLHPKTWGRALGFFAVCSSLFAVRVWLTIHPTTPVATLRSSLILDGGPNGLEPPNILQLTELPPQTAAELAGRERRVRFQVEVRAKPYFAANQIAHLKREIFEESRSKYGVFQKPDKLWRAFKSIIKS